MPPVGFEPTISLGERQQTYALDRAADGTGGIKSCWIRIPSYGHTCLNTTRSHTNILHVHVILLYCLRTILTTQHSTVSMFVNLEARNFDLSWPPTLQFNKITSTFHDWSRYCIFTTDNSAGSIHSICELYRKLLFSRSLLGSFQSEALKR